MYAKQVEIINRSGLHARPGSDFVLEAKKYQSQVKLKRILKDAVPVNAKSLARLLGEGITQGTVIEIMADGPDEQQAVNSLVSLVKSGFGE